MFIRYFSNRNPKFHKKIEKRINVFKLASVGLAVFIIASVLTRACRHSDNSEIFKDWLGNKAVSLYSQLAMREYNIALYRDYLYEEESDSVSYFIDVINGQSNIYSYIKNEGTLLTFSQKDPAYNYVDVTLDKNSESDNKENNNMVADNDSNGNSQSNNINSDNKDKEDDDSLKPNVDTGETDNNDNSSDNNGDNNSDNKETTSDYVVPAVSEVGVKYTMEQLSSFDFLMSKLYTVPSRALVYESDLVAKDMLGKNMTIKGDNSKPQILIYHTHSQEGFADSIKGDDSTSIIGVGAYLAKILSEEYGYNVIHCQEHFDMAGGKLDRSKAYTYAQYTIEQILQDNPTIDVILDLHRDGLKEGAAKLVTNINGKDTAKIMFFNGVSRSSAAGEIDYLYNRYRSDNLAFSFQLKLMAMECYPEFTRRNYIDAYQYNLHHRQKSVLVEVGAQNNTLQEELNAMEVLAEVLHRVIKPQDK